MEVMAAVLVVVGLVILLMILRWAQGRFSLHPEFTRKMAHVLMGCTTLSFPWLFTSVWPVLALGVLTAGVLIYARRNARLKTVLGGVERVSLGEFYFVVSVVLVFWLSNGNVVSYLVPVLVLTLADAVGALVGTRYGMSRYQTDEGFKSWEGSLAFFVVAFLAIHIPVLLMTGTGRAESLLISLTLALLVTLMEGMSWRGMDNLFVPIGTMLLLEVFLLLNVPQLALRLVIIAVVSILALAYRRQTTLTESSAMGAAIFGYLIWALAGWQWFLAPLLLYLLYNRLGKIHGVKVSGKDMQAVIRVMIGPMIFLMLYLQEPSENFALPFYAAFGAHLANVCISREDTPERRSVRVHFLLVSILIPWLIFSASWWLIWGRSPEMLWAALTVLPAVALSAVVFLWSYQFARTGEPTGITWLREALLAPACASLCLIPFLTL